MSDFNREQYYNLDELKGKLADQADSEALLLKQGVVPVQHDGEKFWPKDVVDQLLSAE